MILSTKKMGKITKSVLKILSTGVILAMFGAPVLAAATPDTTTEANTRIANASSPYLRLHASDAVKWYPWGKEAFEQARKLKKPLLVSFGYTACHWCHVMQETHFNVPGIAKSINENFIPVIVDREE